MSTSRLYVDPSYIARAANDDVFALAFARIEAHYFVNAGFFESDGYLIDHVHQLNGLPGVIIQGRYYTDFQCRSNDILFRVFCNSAEHNSRMDFLNNCQSVSRKRPCHIKFIDYQA